MTQGCCQKLLRGVRQREAAFDKWNEVLRIFRIVEQTAGHVAQHPDRDALAVGDVVLRKVSGNRRVNVDLAFVGQDQHGRTGESLRVAGDPEVVVFTHRHARLPVADAAFDEVVAFAVDRDQCDHAWWLDSGVHAVGGHFELLLDCLRQDPWSRIRRATPTNATREKRDC